MEKNPLFNRYIWLVDTIYGAGSITLEEINARWRRSQYNKYGENLPERTFFRHRNAIQTIFGIEIKCNRHDGTYYIAHTDDLEEDGTRKWLLNTFAVNNLINESHQLKRRIVYEEVPSGQRFLTQIIEAMRDEVKLRIEYHSFAREQAHSFLVSPMCVKIFKQRWYMLAQSEGYDEPRIYALDRIKNMETTDILFKIATDFDAKEFFADSFGIIVGVDGVDVERVRISIAKNQANYLRTLPLHESQKEIEANDEKSVFELRLRPTYDFVQELRRYGADVEVLEPEWLREDFRADSMRLAAVYDEKGTDETE